MAVEIINPLDYPGWDNFILTQPDATVFHSSHWARVLCNTYGYRPLYFALREKGVLLAVIPIMGVHSFITGNRGVSLPFTDFCPPIFKEKSQLYDLFKSVKKYGDMAGWRYIEVRGGNGFGHDLLGTSRCFEHVLKLSPNVRLLYNNFHDSCKRNIKKCEKGGVVAEISDSLETVKEFYRLNIISRKRHGLPPQPFSLFRNIHKFIIEKKYGILLIARFQGKAIAGSICVHFGNNAMYKYAASDMKYQYLRHNDFIVWKALEWYCQQKKYTHFSFGRTEEKHEGLRKFKLKWNAEEKIMYYHYNLFQNLGVDKSRQEIKEWQRRILRIMPVSLSRIVGEICYRHIG